VSALQCHCFYSSEALSNQKFTNPKKNRMEQITYSVGLLFFILSCSVLLSFSGSSVEAYKNYTVGDALGWYDKLAKPSVNYQKWVAGKNFSLGDFLSKHPKPSLAKSACLYFFSVCSSFNSFWQLTRISYLLLSFLGVFSFLSCLKL
jgi:hypothetical protein